MVISWDRSPSSARKTTPRVSSVAASMETTFRRVVDDSAVIEHRSKVSPTDPFGPVRRPGYAPVCRLDDSGLLPFANVLRLAGHFGERQEGSEVRTPVIVDSRFQLIR